MRHWMLALAVIAIAALPGRATGMGAAENVDLEDFLSRGSIAYVHVVDIQKIAPQVKDAAVKRLSPEDAIDFDFRLKKLMDMAAPQAETWGIDLNKLLGEIQGLHFALLSINDNFGPPPMIIAVESTTDGYFDKLIQTLAEKKGSPLQPKFVEEINGTKLYNWVSERHEFSPEHKSILDVDSVVFGKHLVFAINARDMLRKMTQTSSGGFQKPSGNKHLEQAKEMAKGKSVCSYGFVDIPLLWSQLKKVVPERERKNMENTDAVFEISQMKALTFAATVDGDITTCAMELSFTPEAEIYDILRQKPAELKNIKFVPADAVMYMSGRLTDPDKTWKRLRQFLADREEEIKMALGYYKMKEEKNETGSNYHQWEHVGRNIAQWEEEEIKAVTGSTIAEIVSAVGNEATCIILPRKVERKDKEHNYTTRMPVMVGCIEVRDASKADELIKKMAKTKGGDSFKKEIYKTQELSIVDEVTYAIVDKVLLLSNSPDGVKAAIDTYKDGKSIASVQNHERLLKESGKSKSKSVYLDFEGLIKWTMGEARDSLGMMEAMLTQGLSSGVQLSLATEEEAGRVRVSVSSSGPYSWLITSSPLDIFILPSTLMFTGRVPATPRKAPMPSSNAAPKKSLDDK